MKGWMNAAVFAVVVGVSGCYSVKVVSPTASAAGVAETKDVFAHTFVYGLVPIGEVNVDDVCGGRGVTEVKTSFGVLTWLATGFTGGLGSPMQVKVTCATAGGGK